MKELDRGQADGKLMIVAAHVPIGVDKNLWDVASSPSESTLIDKLHTYPNLILWIAGHRHYNTVTPFPPKDPVNHPELGFWEVETSSLRDFPQQFRLFEIVRNSDNTISIFTTNVDPSVTPGSPAARSRSYAVADDAIGGPAALPAERRLQRGTSETRCRNGGEDRNRAGRRRPTGAPGVLCNR